MFCSNRCGRPAECTIDGRPYCIAGGCADLDVQADRPLYVDHQAEDRQQLRLQQLEWESRLRWAEAEWARDNPEQAREYGYGEG